MSQMTIFDGHNDTLYQLWKHDGDADYFFASQNSHAISDAAARQGGFGGGFFAIFSPSDTSLDATSATTADKALSDTLEMLAIADRLAAHKGSRFSICRTSSEIATALTQDRIAALLHIEGAEAIGQNSAALHQLYERGVRSIGPLWSRPNIFGEGVPFSFPATPDIGSGLTEAGKELVSSCNQLGMLLDVSHLNEAGFWDIARLSDRPLMATHSNAHALCPSPRNLTDRQLDAIAEQGGIVGVCFATAYLRADGAKQPDTELELIIRQLDYLITRLGEDHVGLGSDFDGAVLPSSLQKCTYLPDLVWQMKQAGFDEALIGKICSDNWLAYLNRYL